MEDSDILLNFFNKLFIFLTGRFPDSPDEIKIFRKHNNKLDRCGDFSFPLNTNGWKKSIDNMTHENTKINIVNYIEKFENKNLTILDFKDLINNSETWNSIYINCVELLNNKVNVFINKKITFQKSIVLILLQKENYCPSPLKINPILVKIEDEGKPSDLTLLRLHLLKDITINMLKISGCTILKNTEEFDESEIVYLSNKSESKCTGKKIICGVVVSNKFGKKNTDISAEEFYKKRTLDMRLMAQHKYGLRVTSEPGWEDFFTRLGNAAVIIDLLHTKPSRPVIITEDSSVSACSKGASFILYNCARLAAIFKQFEQKVSSKIYPELPTIEEIDFGLLIQPEEWELLYIYLMQYPSTVKSCVMDILECRLNTHNLCVFLDSLCSTFSVYYRRVRVLMEPRSHLFPVLHARIYLLMGIQQVLHNALALLNISPIKQM